MSATNRSNVRIPQDFYTTPASAVHAILNRLPSALVSMDHRVLEPAAGDGAILRVLLDRGHQKHKLEAVESWRDRAKCCEELGVNTHCGDFLSDEYAPCAEPKLIITNPPYSLAGEFVKKCLAIAARTDALVCLLLRLRFLESKKRARLLARNPPDVYVLVPRPSFTSDGKTDASAYAWFVWGVSNGNHWYRLDTPSPTVASHWAPA